MDGNDALYGGDGDDTNIVIPGTNGYFAGTRNITGGLYGGDGADYIDGGRGNDYIEGGNGDDGLLGGYGSDTIFGDNADGTGAGGIDWIEGGDGYDQLYGQGGNDVIFGGSGNDSLIGGVGNDLLYGGLGADNFYFGSPYDGYDYVGDFNAAQGDALVFTSANFGGITSATIASHLYVGAGFAGFAVAGPYFAFDTNTARLWYNTPGVPSLVAEIPGTILPSSNMYFA